LITLWVFTHYLQLLVSSITAQPTLMNPVGIALVPDPGSGTLVSEKYKSSALVLRIFP